jgi:hypothetical protein
MRRREHPLSHAIYDVREDGTVEVTATDGTSGIFTDEGVWIEGDLHHADPHLCGWLGGPQLPPRLAVLPRFRETAAATSAAESDTAATR